MAAEPLKNGLGGCPDLETLAAYLDGRLAEHERPAIAEHLATCETCYFVFSEAVQTKGAGVEPTPAPSWWKKKSVVWPSAAAVLAAAAAIVLAVNLAIFNRAADGPELQTLVAAIGTDRTIEPRVTGGFAYGPMRTVRSGEAGDSSLGPDIRIAVASIEKETADDRDAEALHARGIAFLVTGDIERAIATLEAGALERPEDARILSDLAAAYLVRSERDNRPGDLSKAVASVNRAMASDHLLPEALFNRAYALQRLSLTDEARDAWRAYLRVDDQSGWAAEARAHLRALGNQP